MLFRLFSGENIYQVTHNGKILENEDNTPQVHKYEKPALNELEVFANELLGIKNINTANTETARSSLRLSINDVNANKETKKVTFDAIDVTVDNSKYTDLIQDICLQKEEDNLRNELLDMIEENDNI